jgi:hypothetical protein
MMERQSVEVPERLSTREFKKLSEAAQKEYRQRRIEFLCNEHLLHTPDLDRLLEAGRKTLIRNGFPSNVARTGLAISGPSTVGKSSTILEIGRRHHRKEMQGASGWDNFMPTAYVSFGMAHTPKMALMALARFLGLTFATRTNTMDIGEATVAVLNQLGTSLIIVDEVHNMSGVRHQDTEGAAGTLKWLTEHVNATFILAGIGLPSSALFTGTIGAQFGGRFNIYTMEPFSNNSANEREAWKKLVATFESYLLGVLMEHESGSLAAVSDEVFKVPLSPTVGTYSLPHSIGTLKELLVSAALTAIMTGKEKVSVGDLARVFNRAV